MQFMSDSFDQVTDQIMISKHNILGTYLFGYMHSINKTWIMKYIMYIL